MKREVKYPIFLECSVYATDLFWKFIFEDMAFGRFPHSTYLQKDYLCCSIKEKEFVYRVFESFQPTQPAPILFQEIQHLLHDRVGVLSEKELLWKKEQCLAQQEQLSSCLPSSGHGKKKHHVFSSASSLEGEDIQEQHSSEMQTTEEMFHRFRKTMIKENLVEKYILLMKEKYDLSFKISRSILSYILLGFLFKSWTEKDIVLNSHLEIQEIKGIRFQKKKVLLERKWFPLENYESEHLFYFSQHPNNCLSLSSPTSSTSPTSPTSSISSISSISQNIDPQGLSLSCSEPWNLSIDEKSILSLAQIWNKQSSSIILV